MMVVAGKVADKPSTAAVIVAGGSGERFGNPGGKLMLEIGGKPVLSYSLLAFDQVAEVGLIVVVAPAARIDEYLNRAVIPCRLATPVLMAEAGTIRQESSLSGVQTVPEGYELIAIHDGARPLVTPQLIDHVISVVRGDLEIDGAVVGYPAIDTLKLVNGRSILGSPDRSLLWVAQTPQVFRAETIRRAHYLALAEGFVGTDDSSLVERIEGSMVLVEGPRDNIKITVPEDQAQVQAALVSRLEQA